MDSWWYITSPIGEQVELIVFDVETSSRYIYIYDSSPTIPPSYTRTLAYLIGSFASGFHFTSSEGGLVIHYDDRSGNSHGKGIVFEAHIVGMLGEHVSLFLLME